PGQPHDHRFLHGYVGTVGDVPQLVSRAVRQGAAFEVGGGRVPDAGRRVPPAPCRVRSGPPAPARDRPPRQRPRRGPDATRDDVHARRVREALPPREPVQPMTAQQPATEGPIARAEPLRAAVYARIVGLICSGEYQPGAALTVAPLRRPAPACRTPDRAALLRLASQ